MCIKKHWGLNIKTEVFLGIFDRAGWLSSKSRAWDMNPKVDLGGWLDLGPGSELKFKSDPALSLKSNS